MKSFLKFLEQKRGMKIPFDIKYSHFPDELTPEDLDIKGDLDLRYSYIQSLPAGLTVGGYLDLSITKVRSLPAGLKVDGDLDLNDILSKKYGEDGARESINKSGGYVRGDIVIF